LARIGVSHCPILREGRLPRCINIERLRHPDPNWAKQFHDLGLNQN
jgi:hypothetical protein